MRRTERRYSFPFWKNKVELDLVVKDNVDKIELLRKIKQLKEIEEIISFNYVEGMKPLELPEFKSR